MVREVAIVIAIYRPNINWLKEELFSIKRQTYQNFEVVVWNDCPEDNFNYYGLFSEILEGIPVRVFSGDKNLGSNKVFEKLTELATTPYIAYCDQDDIWLPEKLETLLRLIKTKKVSLVCSDMYIINSESNIVANSITNVRPHHIIENFPDMFLHLLKQNFVAGCTVLMKRDVAQQAIPFAKYFYHDHWLALWAALHGGIFAATKPLIKYRIYEGNQTSVLKGIFDQGAYRRERILKYNNKLEEVWERFKREPNFTESICNAVSEKINWGIAREKYFMKPTILNFIQLWKLRNVDLKITWFELLLPLMPNCVFMGIIRKIQKGKI